MKTYSGTLAASGNTTAVRAVIVRGSPRPISVILAGDFGGGTVTPQVSADGTTYAPIVRADGTTLTWADDAADGLNLTPGTYLRLNLAGATNPDIDWWIAVDDGA